VQEGVGQLRLHNRRRGGRGGGGKGAVAWYKARQRRKIKITIVRVSESII
jgi:hypothetical protein